MRAISKKIEHSKHCYICARDSTSYIAIKIGDRVDGDILEVVSVCPSHLALFSKLITEDEETIEKIREKLDISDDTSITTVFRLT